MCVSKTAPKSLTAVAGAINDSPTVTLGRAIFDNFAAIGLAAPQSICYNIVQVVKVLILLIVCTLYLQDIMDGLKEKGHVNLTPSNDTYPDMGVVNAISANSYMKCLGGINRWVRPVSDFRRNGQPDGF